MVLWILIIFKTKPSSIILLISSVGSFLTASCCCCVVFSFIVCNTFLNDSVLLDLGVPGVFDSMVATATLYSNEWNPDGEGSEGTSPSGDFRLLPELGFDSGATRGVESESDILGVVLLSLPMI